MEPQNVLALIVAYYLSRYDRDAYACLGYQTMTGAHQDIGERLRVNPNSIKNMRDEFDSIHDNPRVGWYQREIRPSRATVVDMFQDLTEGDLCEIVKAIIFSEETNEGINQVIDNIERQESDEPTGRRPFIVRGVTGRLAEEFFIKYHQKFQLPEEGKIIDTREHGCGYDFEIVQGHHKFFIEVKGLNAPTGGVLFTGKEWEMASNNGNNYYLALVSNIGDEPEINFIRDPTSKLEAIKKISTTVKIRWMVTEAELDSYIS